MTQPEPGPAASASGSASSSSGRLETEYTQLVRIVSLAYAGDGELKALIQDLGLPVVAIDLTAPVNAAAFEVVRHVCLREQALLTRLVELATVKAPGFKDELATVDVIKVQEQGRRWEPPDTGNGDRRRPWVIPASIAGGALVAFLVIYFAWIRGNDNGGGGGVVTADARPEMAMVACASWPILSAASATDPACEAATGVVDLAARVGHGAEGAVNVPRPWPEGWGELEFRWPLETTRLEIKDLAGKVLLWSNQPVRFPSAEKVALIPPGLDQFDIAIDRGVLRCHSSATQVHALNLEIGATAARVSMARGRALSEWTPVPGATRGPARAWLCLPAGSGTPSMKVMGLGAGRMWFDAGTPTPLALGDAPSICDEGETKQLRVVALPPELASAPLPSAVLRRVQAEPALAALCDEPPLAATINSLECKVGVDYRVACHAGRREICYFDVNNINVKRTSACRGGVSTEIIDKRMRKLHGGQLLDKWKRNCDEVRFCR